MSVASPTVLPRPPHFPRLLPNAPHPFPIPHVPQSRTNARLKPIRNLQREMDNLSDEETEIEDLNALVRHRGFGTIVPIGRNLTQQEEKNDAEEDESDTDSNESNAPPSVTEDAGETSTQDLDASMEDLDDEGDDEEEEEEEDEPEEQSSDI
ncbi:hypothetical protein MKEN_00432400 [Mycena kentingensis (nom. inval.)]|nr:hypothetical protein MKEN_00432400 [Mycena kentingensis (nom. inval.)]